MELETENVRLNEANLSLMRENDYLRMLLDRLIPIPVNEQVETLENKYKKISDRLRKIEEERK